MMRRTVCLTIPWVVSLLTQIPAAIRADELDDFFEARIRPILVETCIRCHGDLKLSGGLRVDSREALFAGGETGPAIVQGQPDESLLIRAIERHEDVSAMPPELDKALRPDQVADFRKWIAAGAHWPAETAKFEVARHWSFEPIRDVEPPDVEGEAWVMTAVDAFIRAKQGAAGVQPAPVADKLTLIRRATFDLTGLPPTPAEIRAFEEDHSPEAFETVIDRLLMSPAYGERWGRHWLDVVRYADTAGETADYPVPLAWRYRNYVIDAFNQDKPYDEFLREQIAGDILAELGPRECYAERATATGYLAISRRFGFDSENYHHLTIQDTIDTLGQTVLGLSLGCARCHDHKFDPITMQDYYGLYGIFDSSRYAFPGSEQKKQVRAMLPLVPASESQPEWREFAFHLASLAEAAATLKQSVPSSILRSLDDIDGDFELQAPAAGGSNGVLVPPWLYSGTIAVTTAAQSPYKNLYPQGKVGASVPAVSGEYRIAQAISPRFSVDERPNLSVNLDFRVATTEDNAAAPHRFWIGSQPDIPAFEILISSESVSLQSGESVERLGAVSPNEWQNLQLVLDLDRRTLSGSLGTPEYKTTFMDKPCSSEWSGSIDLVVFDSHGPSDSHRSAIEYDNLGVQKTPIAPVSTEAPPFQEIGIDYVALTNELEELTRFDGDLELQTEDSPPASPWGPGPNSVVRISSSSQSPFVNIYPAGEVGISLPNRGEYDGFGRSLTDVETDEEGKLFVSFDFRCANDSAGGDGSWRYYLGHGPGQSAAIELFFNGHDFFRRSADSRDAVCSLNVGEWYQVQLTLDLNAKSYVGLLASSANPVEFSGEFATGWDGTIDYTFIDSYGHIGGVRPALDADNFALSSTRLPEFGSEPLEAASLDRDARLARVAEIRQQLSVHSPGDELKRLLEDGPFAMAYGVSEGTPHNVRMQIRGEPDQPGEEIPRGFIKVLGGNPLGPDVMGSGRLELAQWLTSPENPLTARVMVNRIWQFHFGQGLVQTSNDFGVRGIPPTHPELLDYLAVQFIQSGWSVKAMHRLIMLSATYQESSRAEIPQGTGMDHLYIRFPRRRLSAEEIRDTILAVSGELDATPGEGHPFPTPTSWGYTQHGPFSAVYDHNKRSVYLMTQRLKRHPFLALFDGADPNTSTPVRLGTTVPTQALFFLNDLFVHEKADMWSARLQASSDDEDDWIELAWTHAFGRSPTQAEHDEAITFLADYRAELRASGMDNVEQRSLAALLRTLVGSNEFLHVD